jgi:hypothetical protein
MSSCAPALRKARAISLARASTTWRVEGVGRLAGHVDIGVEELVGGVAQALLAGREDLLQALQLRRARASTLAIGTRLLRPRGSGRLVVRALHGRHVDALAEEAGAGELPARGGPATLWRE